MLELFHAVADAASAAARKRVVEWKLEAQVRFRNIAYPEVQSDFAARGGTQVPALWDGRELVQGLEPVVARLKQLR